MTPPGRRCPDVAVWAITTDVPGTWRVLEGVHRDGTYTEQVLLPYVAAGTVLTALHALQEHTPT